MLAHASSSFSGLLLSVLSSVVFAIIGVYGLWLAPLSGHEVFAWRILSTIPAMLLLLTLLRHWPRFAPTLTRLRREPLLWLVLAVNGFLLGFQQWLFMWAPMQGRLLEVTLGYFLLPLVMVLAGRVFYGERLNRLQWLAVLLASAGVAHEWWQSPVFSWIVLATALGYPPYLMLRRAVKLEPVGGFLLEILFIAPFAFWLLGSQPLLALNAKPALCWLIPGLGLLTAIAFASYLAASRLLPLGMLGILGYVEPALLFAVSVLWLNEPFTLQQLGTYAPIWLAIALVCLNSALELRRGDAGAQQVAH